MRAARPRAKANAKNAFDAPVTPVRLASIFRRLFPTLAEWPPEKWLGLPIGLPWGSPVFVASRMRSSEEFDFYAVAYGSSGHVLRPSIGLRTAASRAAARGRLARSHQLGVEGFDSTSALRSSQRQMIAAIGTVLGPV